MTTIEKIADYQNGNCVVSLFNDGTKTREWEGISYPELPESIDLKITDYCDAGCAYCHEKSTKRGKHADLKTILSIVEGLPRGAEIAIGGGDPLSHPDLLLILQSFKENGLIANLTINEKHFPHVNAMVIELQNHKLLYGVGVSVKDVSVDFIWQQILPMPKNLVYHVIAGIANPQALLTHGNNIERILVLGYKHFGFGIKCNEKKLEENLNKWRYWIGTILKKVPHVSFDNLGIKQLGIEKIISPSAWSKHYMGDDGQFTMYVDAVRNEYAISSTSNRISIANKSISEMFKSLTLKK